MNPRAADVLQVPASAAAAAAPRPFVWSVRRELWENRFLYLAPLVVTAFVLVGSLIGTIGLPRRMATLSTLDPAQQHQVVFKPFGLAPAPIMLTTILVGMFYCLDALYGERRDRSILFWKSLPVSDRTAVLAKASIPLAVLPLLAFALSLATVAFLLLVSTIVLLGSGGGGGAALLWSEFRTFQMPVVMLYGLIAHALWFAPIYGWLLLTSAWARRAPLLWAVLPWLAVAAVERLAFGTWRFMAMLQFRVAGAMEQGFFSQPQRGADGGIDQLAQLTPVKFLTTPGLWLGLGFAAACLAAAVRQRRNREPV